jgi:predicted transcriptional regulator YheO
MAPEDGLPLSAALPADVVSDTLELPALAGTNVAQHPELFALLKELAQGVVRTFGSNVCEVVIHDLADLEHSIVWIEGDVTHRHIGGGMTDLGLELIRAGKTDNLLAYRTYVGGNILQSSSIFLRDEEGRAWGSFCINFNITALHNFQRFLETFAPPGDHSGVKEKFTDDIEETLHGLIAEAGSRIGKPLPELTRDERLELVRLLEQRGAFLVRRAVPTIAKSLNVTRYTVYNYLSEIRGDMGAGLSPEGARTEE